MRGSLVVPGTLGRRDGRRVGAMGGGNCVEPPPEDPPMLTAGVCDRDTLSAGQRPWLVFPEASDEAGLAASAVSSDSLGRYALPVGGIRGDPGRLAPGEGSGSWVAAARAEARLNARAEARLNALFSASGNVSKALMALLL